MTSRFSSALAAASLAGVAVVGMSAPALAQTASGPGTTSPGASDDTVVLNQTFTLTTGDNECPAGAPTAVAIRGNGFSDSRNTTADNTGTATITYQVPGSARTGSASATFTCGANTIVVPFSVVASSAAGTTTRSGSLPRTGADNLVPIGIAGAVLVAVGAGTVAAARRRRDALPAGTA